MNWPDARKGSPRLTARTSCRVPAGERIRCRGAGRLSSKSMDSSVRSLLASGVTLTDAALERLLPSPDTLPHSIHRAMRHSVFAGGKRLRPILCMEAARMVAGGTEIPAGAADLGAALEMIHTYSL